MPKSKFVSERKLKAGGPKPRLGLVETILPLVIFLIAFVAIPLRQLNSFSMMPGDIGDGRLNNYFLERVFVWVTGQSDSFWNMDFFFPFPLVGGLSDNHFGSAPFYIVPRLLELSPETSFQVWFLLGYALNFFSAYFVLKRLGMGSFAAAFGGIVFAFALPTSGHSGHAQLHHRWALPVAVFALYRFFETKGLTWVGISLAAIVTQFYIGVYSGFFAMLLVVAISFAYFFIALFRTKSRHDFRDSWVRIYRAESGRSFWNFLAITGLSVLSLGLLFFPYFQVSRMYTGSRSWEEISTMLPRPSSYLIADHSSFWGSFSAMFQDIPMRHEHQMFFGLVPLLLTLGATYLAFRVRHKPSMAILAGGFLVVGVSLFFLNFSLWFLVHDLPLVSAIRAVTRVDQTLLMVGSYASAFLVNWLLSRISVGVGPKIIAGLTLGTLLIAEAATGGMRVSSKAEWRERVASLDENVPHRLEEDSILFFSQQRYPWFADEIDAMWVSLHRGKPTINGYTGQFPPNWSLDFGRDCLELPLRLDSFGRWANQRGVDSENYQSLFARVVPVGFDNCEESWARESPWQGAPLPNLRSGPIPPEVFSNLSLEIDNFQLSDGFLIIEVSIVNSGSDFVAVRALGPESIKLSWAQPPELEFVSRVSLVADIPPNQASQVLVRIPLQELNLEEPVSVTSVQELVFWGHDVGVAMVEVEDWWK